MPHILAIDQGTSSSRAIVFDDGRVVATGQRPFDQSFPADGWVEQDPEALWRTTLGAAEDALAAAGIEARQVAAIGIANQRETRTCEATGDWSGSEPICECMLYCTR